MKDIGIILVSYVLPLGVGMVGVCNGGAAPTIVGALVICTVLLFTRIRSRG